MANFNFIKEIKKTEFKAINYGRAFGAIALAVQATGEGSFNLWQVGACTLFGYGLSYHGG